MRPPLLSHIEIRAQSHVCFVPGLQAVFAPSGSVQDSGPTGGPGQDTVKRWQQRADPGYEEALLPATSHPGEQPQHSNPESSASPCWATAPRSPSCTQAVEMPLDPLHGAGLGVPRTIPLVLLPEGLPAVLFHVVLRTFTFKGGDEEC